jgi:N-methylhydantoinase B/oxoprolinase/acetone carboxylase alpha subunit
MPSFSKCLAEEGAAFMGFKLVENGTFQEEEVS